MAPNVLGGAPRFSGACVDAVETPHRARPLENGSGAKPGSGALESMLRFLIHRTDRTDLAAAGTGLQ
jgi:hypothetical protein